jgi:hypothetical protein
MTNGTAKKILEPFHHQESNHDGTSAGGSRGNVLVHASLRVLKGNFTRLWMLSIFETEVTPRIG